MNSPRCLLVLTMVFFVGLSSAGAAAAQVCIGFPTARGQAAAAVRAGFPTGGNTFGVEAGYHLLQGFSIFAEASVHTPEAGDNTTTIGGGAAFSVPELRPAVLPFGLYSCPVIGVSVATGGGFDDNAVTVPIGVGFGTILPLGSMSLSPYVVPQFRWTTLGGETSTDWGLSGGAILVGFLGPRVYAGGTISRLFSEGAESIFGVKIGLIL